MTFKEKINYIHDHPEVYLERDRSGKGWVCPICGSGSGRHGTGISSKKGDFHFTCWGGGCFTSSDIIDIIGIAEGLSDNRSKIRRAFEIYGL